jgi:hypothetical protein
MMRLGLRVSSSSKVLFKYITLFGELEEEIVCLVDMEAEGGYYRQSRCIDPISFSLWSRTRSADSAASSFQNVLPTSDT